MLEQSQSLFLAKVFGNLSSVRFIVYLVVRRRGKNKSDKLRLVQIALQLKQVVQGQCQVVCGLAQVLELLWVHFLKVNLASDTN